MPGWYPDPVTLGATRYWDGERWTADVTFQGRRYRDSTDLDRVELLSNRTDAALIRTYLDDAVTRMVVTNTMANLLRHDLDALVATPTQTHRPQVATMGRPTRDALVSTAAPKTSASTARTDAPPPQAAAARTHAAAPATATSTQRAARPAPAPVVIEPSPLARWWSQFRQAVVSDIAVHGLAYLGVALLFAGVFGMIAFSFGDVEPAWRGLAGVAAPSACFVAGAYLRRRNAVAVATALALLGGAISPIVAIAVFTDGSPYPPDIHGVALPLVQAAACLLLAMGMAGAALRWPTSAMRFTAAPSAWLAVGVLVGFTRDPVPTGEAVARASALQIALILAAVAVTQLAIAVRRPTSPLARATSAITLPIAASMYALELVLAGTHGWPRVSGVIVTVSACVIMETLGRRVPLLVVTLAQLTVVLVGVARLGGVIDTYWLGFATATGLLAYAEYVGWRRPNKSATAVVLTCVVAAVALTLTSPWAGLASCAVVFVWLIGRRVVRVPWLPVELDPYGAAPGLFSVGALYEYWRITGDHTTVLTLSILALVTQDLMRWWGRASERADDLLWTWWPPAAGAVAAASVMGSAWADRQWTVAAVMAISALTAARTTLLVPLRVWIVSGFTAWSLVAVGHACQLQLVEIVVIAAGVGFLLVVIGSIVTTTITNHLALIGHVASVATVCVPTGQSWAATSVFAFAGTGLLVAAGAHEAGMSNHLSLLAAGSNAARRVIATIALLLGVAATTTAATLALDAGSVIAFTSQWSPLPTVVAALLVATMSRVVHWRWVLPIVMHHVAVAASTTVGLVTTTRVSSLASAPGVDRVPGWPTITSLAVGIAIALMASAPRARTTVWLGWLQTAPLITLLADQAGLDRRWSSLVVAGWGATLLVAAVSWDRTRHGAARNHEVFRAKVCTAPAVLGAMGFVGGTMLSIVDATRLVQGRLLIGAALVVFAVAVIRPLAALSGLGHIALTLGLLIVIPWQPSEHPWSLIIWAALLCQLAWLGQPELRTDVPDDLESAERWDLPPFIVAHAVAAAALLLAPRHGVVPATYVAAGALSLVIALALRQAAWAIGAGALFLVGAAAAGPGWLALTLLSEGVVLTAVGLHRRDDLRRPQVALGSLWLLGSWSSFVVWLSWAPSTVFDTTVPAAAVIAVATALALRFEVRPRVLHENWFWLSAAIVVSSAVVEPLGIDLAHRHAALVAVGSYLVVAVAFGCTTDTYGQNSRWLSTAMAVGALGITVWAYEVAASTIAFGGSLLALATCVALLVAHGVAPSWPWIAPVLAAAMSTQLAAVIALVEGATQEAHLTEVVLLTLAAECAAVAMIEQQPSMLLGAPVLAAAAWLTFAADTFHDEQNWFTVPIGVTVLVIVGLLRWIRRGRGESPTITELALLEYVGMSFMVAASTIRVINGQLWHSLVVIAVGCALAVWGTATRVIRRAGFGVASVLLAAVLVVAVPLVEVAPTLSGAGLWLAIAGVGAAAIAIAALIEQGRSAVRRLARALSDVTAEWEHTGGRDVHQHRPPRAGGRHHPAPLA